MVGGGGRYKDSTKTVFKSPTRLECMMQDYPKTLQPSAKVGFTVCDVWLGYSPVKNNAVDAAAKVPTRLLWVVGCALCLYGGVVQMASGTPPHSGTSGEMDLYRANCFILKKVKETKWEWKE